MGEEMEGALQCVYTFAEKLGKNYGPFIPQTALALVPIFGFQMSESVRDWAFLSWGQLCNCARQANESAMLMQLVQQLMQCLVPKLEAPNEPLDAQVTRIEGMMTCLEKAGPGILSTDQIRHLCQLTARLLGESFVRKEQAEVKKGKSAAANESNTGPILDAISVGLDDPCHRVGIAAMKAMHHFCEAVDREDLEPRLPEMMQKLGAKLQAGDSAQQEAILCVSVIAQTTEDGFAHYYPQLMPHLKQVIGSSVQKVEKRELLGRALDCISILANVVGKEVFRADVVAIMSAMAQLTKAEGVPKNDPVQEYIMSAAQRICSTMKEDFSPFLPDLLPLILGKFAFTPKLVRGEADIENNDDDVSLAIVHEGGEAKMLAMSSSEMEELESALRCIYTFAEKLGKNYGPFIPQTALSLVPIFDFQM